MQETEENLTGIHKADIPEIYGSIPQYHMQEGMRIVIASFLTSKGVGSFEELKRQPYFSPSPSSEDSFEQFASETLVFFGHWVGLQYLHGARNADFQPYSSEAYSDLMQKSGIRRVLEIGPGFNPLLPYYRSLLGKNAFLSWIGPHGPGNFPGITGHFPDDMPYESYDLIISKGVFCTGGMASDTPAIIPIMGLDDFLSRRNPFSLSVSSALMHTSINLGSLTSLNYFADLFNNPCHLAMLPMVPDVDGIWSDLVMTSPHFHKLQSHAPKPK
ncbi:hypothetical protein A2Z00_04445 [Candidatus Gottesmanbacteria bacterium RBG_13_45_10]|uniref:Uncharacterized protein n=1 Tax=Candidatus Gottesmanbacteria bacterium RBG_13_45_10 TaxID=1798370 RepID=A0A1F5ZI37_9BACT|nr:MAG: hypothetical protein A2Z00_04445 [Candidatus Gottesmanbacteria bacterium RBG_13_45_10]